MNTNTFTSKETREFLDEELGPGEWKLKYYPETTSRETYWERVRGWDTIRVKDYKHGVIIESRTRKNTHNYCENLEELEYWVEVYLEQEDYGLQ